MPIRTTLLALALAFSGCSGIVRAPTVIVGPAPGGASELLLDRVVRASTDAGWQATLVQANRGRFALRAHHHDELGPYAFAVELFQDGRVTITPHGPRVERSQRSQRYLMPAPLRDEYNALTEVISRVVRARS